MNKGLLLLIMTACLLITAGTVSADDRHRLGGGVHYWTTLDNIDIKEVDESGVAWLISYQYLPTALFTFELDLEVFPSGFGGSEETVFAPQVFGLLGSWVYGGLGIGAYYADGELSNDPFFTLRAGVDLEIMPSLHLDINANYIFSNFSNITDVPEDVDTDTITLGALVRFGF
jgi:hypothetical protein